MQFQNNSHRAILQERLDADRGDREIAPLENGSLEEAAEQSADSLKRSLFSTSTSGCTVSLFETELMDAWA